MTIIASSYGPRSNNKPYKKLIVTLKSKQEDVI